ncbi:cell division protein ZapD [Macromonas nakdongensis]|uniref:cell division protein ZapD n=1 Tax=Macromonas nakdongensis TaxID=1843082 RepID=UPI000C327E4F|nr:cell division protein ZapD [Macromonas nakdongensis]
MILYEYPFNERIRTYLRLEQLFRRLAELVSRHHPLDHHFAIQTLFEIMDVGARSDLKSEILKDLDKLKQVYNGYRGNPAISEAALDQFIARIDACFNALHDDAGRVGHGLSENEWLMAIRSRISIPGGTCEFDLPAYHDWQHRPAELRQHELNNWVQELAALAQPIQLLMGLLRESGVPQKVTAIGGQYQQNLPQGRTFQLLRLWVDPALELVPEISGNRLLFSVRLMQRGPDGKLQIAADRNADLEVTLCA